MNLRRNARFLLVVVAMIVMCWQAVEPTFAQSASQARAQAERARRQAQLRMEKQRRDMQRRMEEMRQRSRSQFGNKAAPGSSLPTYRSPQGVTTHPRSTSLPSTGSTRSTSRSVGPTTRPSQAYKTTTPYGQKPESEKKKSLFPHERSELKYHFRRGQELAFDVHMELSKTAYRKIWVGKPYVLGVYSGEQGKPSEILCVGTLKCYLLAGEQRLPQPAEDITFPVHMRFIGVGVLSSQVSTLFSKPSLPYQMSVMLPIQEFLFPDLPWWKDEPKTSTGSVTFYETGGQYGMKKLNGEMTRSQRIEKGGEIPRVINERRFYCKHAEVGVGIRQISKFDEREGCVTDTDMAYDQQYNGNYHISVKIRRIRGKAVKQVRQKALTTFPASKWPKALKRVPAPVENSTHWIESVQTLRPGQSIIYSHMTNATNAEYTRTVRAKVVKLVSDKKVLVRLDGTGEEFEANRMKLYHVR